MGWAGGGDEAGGSNGTGTAEAFERGRGAAGAAGAGTVGATRAAKELDLRRGEFELAVQLGHIRTVLAARGGRRLVERAEIDRLRAAGGFPDALRERVRTVGTAEGARLLSVSPGRFTRLARAGYITPMRFYLNRYRVIVWLYVADELRAFAAGEPALLVGRFPKAVGETAGPEEDRRGRNWRARRVGHLLRRSADPWERAAVIGAVLGAARLAEAVPDPYERAYLNRLRPILAPAHPESEAARAAVQGVLLAGHPDEVRWYRASLTVLLEEARLAKAAPRPGAAPGPASASAPEPAPDTEVRPDCRPQEPPTARAPEVPRRGGRGSLLTRLGVRNERNPGLGAAR
ncbi:DUF6397 family protein [Streptomyces sp. 150FB]|uniref:DUF6397 family protein n=1 Tax=Streptomyces sp. 150FB TaxID=1576605 RepID=UPI0006966A94|nr:DUF6397 family protein [Streptomyces sp. 150FB]